MANILTIDDTNASIIYSAGWAQVGLPNEYNKTGTGTIIAGSTAKLSFTGTGIGVFGTVPAKQTLASVAPVSAYSIDGGAPTLFRATEAGQTQFSQLFYQSPLLPEGTHTLTITHPAVSDIFVLDFFMVTQNTPSTPTLPVGGLTPTSTSANVTSAATTSSSILTTLSTTTLASSTIASTSTTPQPVTITVTSIAQTTTPSSGADSLSSNSSNKNSAASTNHTGAIVGGILGAVLVLFLIVFGVIIWRRKRRDKRSSMIASNFWNTGTSTSTPPPPPKPFTSAPAPESPRMNNNVPIMAQTTGGSASYSTPRYPGGYAPAAPANQAVTYGGYAPSAPYSYPASGERGYYSQGPDQGYHQGYSDPGYSAGTYLPPSQILRANAGNDYGRGGR